MKLFKAEAVRPGILVSTATLALALLATGCATSWLDQAKREISDAERSGDKVALAKALAKRGESWAARAVHAGNGASSTTSMAGWAETDFIAAHSNLAKASDAAGGLAMLKRCVDLLMPAGFGAACDQKWLEASTTGDAVSTDSSAREQFAQRQSRRQANRATFERLVAGAEARQRAEREAEAARSEARQRMAAAVLSGVIAGSQQAQQSSAIRASSPAPRATYVPAPSVSQTVITPYVPNISVASRNEGTQSSGSGSGSSQGSSTKSRYSSQSANQCLSVVTSQQVSGCSGPLCLRNSCSSGVYVLWGINGGTMHYGGRVMPGRSLTVNPLGSRRDTIAWNACSLDPAAPEWNNPSVRKGCVYF